MRFYTKQHKLLLRNRPAHEEDVYLHSRWHGGNRDPPEYRTDPEAFLSVIAAYREDIVVAVECMFTWYWIADLLCQRGDSLRSWTRSLHESNPRRQKQKR